MTTAAILPLNKITLHPDNVRRVAEADEEMVDSIKSLGILQAIVVVQDGDHYLLIAGHRRIDGARKAGLTSIRSEIHDHLVTRAQQIEAMLVENGRRADLTAIEEAKAYEQLTFEGYKPKDIAKATGRSIKTVNERLTLTKLSDQAQEGVHAHQISLEQAAKLTELEEFPDILARVEESIGTNNFAHALASVHWEVDRRKQHRDTRKAFTDAGLTHVEMPDGGWDWDKGPVPYRGLLEDCVADAWYDGDGYTGPSLALLVPKATDVDADAGAKEQRESEWEKRRAEREARDEARAAARELRIVHVRGVFAKVKLPPAVLSFLNLSSAVESVSYSQHRLDLYGGVPLERKEKSPYGSDWDLHRQITGLKPAAATTYAFSIRTAELEELLTRGYQFPDQAQAALDYFDLLTSTGYVLSDTEVEQVQEIKQALTRLQSEGDA